MAGEYKDYYKILGIEKTAEAKDIKAAYRKMARKFHPDVNAGDKTAEDKFKDIGEAYEVLSDPEKRTKYDQYGEQWKAFSQGGGFADQAGAGRGGGGGTYADFGAAGFGGLDDLFASLFGGEPAGRGGGAQGFGGFRSASTRPRGASSHRGGSTELNVEVSLEEAYHGTTRSFQIKVPEQCKRCNGQGAIMAGKGKPCPTCGGSGKSRNGRSLFGAECPQCGGTGQAMEVCPECHGSGSVERNKRLTDVKLPAGIKQDQRVRLAGQGPDGSDLYLKVHIRPDSRYEVKNDDLYSDFPVPFTVAALGGEASVETLEGRKVVRIPAGTQTGTSFRLTGLGMPNLRGGVRGNLYARSKITVPKELSPRERDLLTEIAKLRKDDIKVS